MADQQQGNVQALAFPSPPPFYQHFTEENLARVSVLRAGRESDSSQKDDSPKEPELQGDLQYLQPPEPPAEGTYRSFGDIYNLNDILPSLTEQGIEQLYSPPATPSGSSAGPDKQSHSDRTLILKRIAKSLLLNFLELMGIMSVNPEQYAEKIQDLRTLFINFHHLLNEYRPHQARESLILMMEAQLARSKAETNGIESMKTKVEGILAGLGQVNIAPEEAEEYKDTKKDLEEYDGAKDVWDELHREYGLVEPVISS
ncbi:mediator complex subunit med7 [Pseudogymnoascus destructans]|uniref:Mediator of RNA polymerase II transcription subunit 7 n=2 Tax=Pseudogymnoascus destructans TaxID=655981 RepID=L8G5G3_PSED2|nr:mediator complex subunit med7 [Pseudogymnoascus destructans]ELR07191.1 hypothetical protein GMDG_02418 [Pseudogymnoascus destructans 20631-21]OAF61803.1 mediator complex subunit med7 [Pseudogymnoascus destructans]